MHYEMKMSTWPVCVLLQNKGFAQIKLSPQTQ